MYYSEAIRELTSNSIGYCICGEKICFKDCEVCDILLNDKLNGKKNKVYKSVNHNDNLSNL